MTVRQWYLGIAAASAALIPFSAHAVDVMNLSDSPHYIAGAPYTIDFAGVTAENGNTFPNNSGVNGGSCTALGSCDETTFGVGKINSIQNASGNLWTSGVASAANPNGYVLGFVLYGIADLSVTAGGSPLTETIDNTGANNTSQGNVTYTTPNGGSKTVDVGTGQDGSIHLALYYMPANETPCFTAGCGSATTVEIDSTSRTSASTVNGISNAAGGGLFADFTLSSGALPLNTAEDGSTNSLVTLTQVFKPGDSSGNGDAYTNCVTPGTGVTVSCGNFAPVTEGSLDGTGTGYSGDPSFASDIVNAFLQYDIHAATEPLTLANGTPCFVASATCKANPKAGEHGAGWFLNVKDPVTAFSASAPVPEPASLGLLGSALAFFGFAIHRRRKGTSA